MTVDVAGLSDAELVEELSGWAGRVAAGEAVLLRLIGELDVREAWAQWGVLSCAHWVSWKLGMTVPTAWERVRVARCLRELPLLADVLAAGRVSYAQARAITRVATSADEAQWVDLARFTTAAQLEKAARGVERARSKPKPVEEQPPAMVTSWETDGTLLLRVRIAAQHAPAVLAVLEGARLVEQNDRDALYCALADRVVDASPEAPHVSAETSDAAAEAEADRAAVPAPAPYAAPYDYVEPPYPRLQSQVDICRPRRPEDVAALAAWTAERDRRKALRDAARAWEDHVTLQALAAELPARHATLADGLVRALTRPAGLKPVTVQLLLDPVSGWARTRTDELLPPRSLASILRTLPGRGKAGEPVTVGSLLGQLDGERCRFPSCDRTRHLHAHHVTFWRNGGPTDLANLLLVCSRHHTLIHDEGFQLVLSADRTLTVRTAADIPVPHHPTPPPAQAGRLDATIAPYQSEWANDPFNLSHVVWVLLQHST